MREEIRIIVRAIRERFSNKVWVVNVQEDGSFIQGPQRLCDLSPDEQTIIRQSLKR